jgi:type VI protein secretion system component VasF
VNVDDAESTTSQPEALSANQKREQYRNPLRRNPRLQIWLIAGVFYAILAGMYLFVIVLIIRG